MSDTNPYEHTINNLTSEAAKYRAQKSRLIEKLDGLKKDLEAERQTRLDLESQLKAVSAERDDWRVKFETSPQDKDAEIQRLSQELRTRDHKSTFKELYNDRELGLNEAVSVDKLWKILDYKVEGDPDPNQIKSQVSALRESDPYLFKPADATSAPPATGSGKQPAPPQGKPFQAGPGFDRGLPESGSGKLVVSRRDIRDPEWQQKNQSRYAQALQRDEVVFVD